jgi:hypothetical protein
MDGGKRGNYIFSFLPFGPIQNSSAAAKIVFHAWRANM